jgi:hypothetical protein
MNWRTKIIKHYLKQVDTSYGLIIGALPVQDDDCSRADSVYPLPEEIKEIYSIHDGFGLVKEKGEILWQLPPRYQLPQLKATCCDWFADTHPELVHSVFPFLDGFTGTYLLVLVENGKILQGIFEFDHENYDFEPNQPWSEFIVKVYDRFEEFFED